jgi:phosphoglycolate phosphatase-like HAD superfamily hydrolase
LTLVNSLKANKIAYNAVCGEVGEKPTEKGFKRFIGSSVTKNVNYFYNKHRKTYKGTKAKLRHDVLKGAFMKNLHTIKVYDASILRDLKKKGIKIAIITGNAEAVIRAIAKKHKMPYDALYGDEHTKGKSKMWAIKELIKRFKLKKKDVIYVGDHPNDIKQAHRAGVKALITPSPGVYKKDFLKKLHADFYCSNLKCVARTVK